MNSVLIKNIGTLLGISEATSAVRGAAMERVEAITDAYLLIVDGEIASFGEMASCPVVEDIEVLDAQGGIVHPAFCDSHTHLVYAGSREDEFIDKINGLSYEEIARRGGGILNSADRLNEASEDELFDSALRRLRQIAEKGTGAVEIKSGYGLTLDGELKMLRVIARLRKAMPEMAVKATFLGAHAVGRAFAGRQGDYVDHIIADMLPAVAAEGNADFVDVFCDAGFFTVEETDRILKAAAKVGLRPKIHANELDVSGGVQVGVANGALSVDHLERAESEELELLAGADTVATMLPGASFFLGMPYGKARRAVEAGCAVALASDWNPGSSPSGSMPMVMSLGCIKMKLSPEMALNAVTINGAAAMDLARSYGSVARGKAGSVVIYHPWVPSLNYIPYAYTEPQIAHVVLRGKTII
ncbi:MAG: imidazolonepropionase [Bacteroides sp.]|nr:imidazolonepropionase [Bacteroides sp.]